jgi:hypothetical protein
MMISSSSSAAVGGSLRMPRSSTMSRGTVHQELHVLFAGAVDCGFGQLIEQGMGLAVEHAKTLLDSGLADGLSQTAAAFIPRREDTLFLGPPGTRCEER